MSAQSIQALQRANTVRLARMELRRDVRAGAVLVAEILRGEIPDWMARMPAEQLILSVPRMQKRVYHRAMYAAGAKLTATIGDLTERKRYVLADRIGEWELRHWAKHAKEAMA